MIKTPLSTMIGGAFWTPSAMILGGASKTLNQIIKSLFANNEQGFFYDPNDLSTMYQDAAGTVPVTAVGQPVGLVLDKSKGLVLGGNVFVNTVNGYFDSGSTTELLTGTLEKTTAWMSVNPDTFYKIETNGSSADRCRIQVKNASGVISYLTQYSFEGNATYPRYAKTNSDSVLMRIYFKSSAGNATGLIIRAITGNHAYQTVSASRPILQRNATTGAYYLAFDGADDFLQTSNIDFTATDKVSLFAGVRKLSDYSTGKIVELSNSVGNIGTFSLNAPDSNGASNFSFGTNGTALSDVKVSGFASPTSNVLTVFGNNAASTVQLKNRLRVDGVYPTATYGGSIGAGNYGNYPIYIGRRGGTSIPFNGHLYSLIGIGRLTTDSETIALEKSIAKNTGVTLNV